MTRAERLAAVVASSATSSGFDRRDHRARGDHALVRVARAAQSAAMVASSGTSSRFDHDRSPVGVTRAARLAAAVASSGALSGVDHRGRRARGDHCRVRDAR
jgi:hypothetical protein